MCPFSAPRISDDDDDRVNSPTEVAGGCLDTDGEEPVVDGDDAPDSRSLDIAVTKSERWTKNDGLPKHALPSLQLSGRGGHWSTRSVMLSDFCNSYEESIPRGVSRNHLLAIWIGIKKPPNVQFLFVACHITK